ncbi:extracellular solute-binding protein [Paenibacillus sp. N3.4]|uniref:extracellular solute-binding protein n=1 Tax=Paenibacillus sp. N3.4 TaxID=2603222 RepID=UPI0011CB69AE|nr:extracellular solute-binding protein [Paenibacillus sp. N3.4]TXK84189.1 extracellular solute-binding protein [Paenibacillus sp. N3.4]
MKKSMKALTVTSTFLLAASLLAACSKGEVRTQSTDSSKQPAQTAQAIEKKYKIRAMNILYGAAPPDSSTGKKAIEDRYNIEFDYIPVAAGEYNNKMGVTLASGDIPDTVLFPYLDAIYFNAIGSDQFLPLEAYLADSKNYPNLAKLPKEVMDTLKNKGHIYGIPRLRGIPGATLVMRKDWLDKLGMKVPTTYDELYEVMKAFKEKDPDGNGKDDTYGLAAGVNSGAGINGAYPFVSLMASMKAGPSVGWVEDGKGGIVPGEFAPNNKAAIGYLAKLYKEGIIAKDFAIKKDQQVEDDFLLGKAGVVANWGYTGFTPERLTKAKAANPKFEMIAIPPLKAADGSDGGYVKSSGFFGVFALNKDLLKDEGKLKKVLKILDDQMGDEGANFFKWGVDGIHYKTDNGQKAVTDLGKTEGPNKYQLTNHANEGEWILSSADTPETTKLKQNSFAVAMQGKPYTSQEVGLFSQTYADKGAELYKSTVDGVVKIIVGEKPVDYLDQMFDEWKTRGGKQVLTEMNEAWRARK